MPDEAGLSYKEMIETARRFNTDGEYACDGGRWEGVYADDTFWDAWEIVTGEKAKDRGGIFSCSC